MTRRDHSLWCNQRPRQTRVACKKFAFVRPRIRVAPQPVLGQRASPHRSVIRFSSGPLCSISREHMVLKIHSPVQVPVRSVGSPLECIGAPNKANVPLASAENASRRGSESQGRYRQVCRDKVRSIPRRDGK